MKKSILLTLALIFGSAAIAKIEIQNAWIHPSKGPNTSLFMKIINTSDKPDHLIDVKGNENPFVQFHQNTEVDGKLQLTLVNSFQIPPKGNLQLNPGQDHVMLQNIRGPLKVGDSVKVRLEFASGQKIDLFVPVKKSATSSVQPDSNNLMMQ